MITNRLNFTCRIRSHLKTELELISSQTVVEGLNPLGRVKSASLTIRGRVLSLPDGFVPTVKDDSEGHWVCYIPELGHVFIEYDWKPRRPWKGDVGLSKKMLKQLRLLLVASCCSEQQRNNTRCGYCNRILGEVKIPCPINEYRCGECNNITLEDIADITFKPEYLDTIYQHAESASGCPHCAQDPQKKDIWGLLIFPTGQINTYYRVGVLLSRAEQGGSRIFYNVKE